MSTPIITNRAPAPGEIVGVADSTGFSARDRDGEIVRSSLNAHVGAGPGFWEGGFLPEDHPDIDFVFKALVGKPKNFSTRTILGGGEMQIDKIAVNQEAIYEWGGLQSPADPDDPIMVEFTLELPEGSLSTDGTDYTGVLVGMKINDTGVAIKFFTDLIGTRWIEIHDVNNSVTVPPSGTYQANYDWDQSIPHTYKLLWQPKMDLLRLYISTGQDNLTPDVLLIDGKVSDFPSTLPALEIPTAQPIAFFGHGLATTYSTSIWYNTYLCNLVVSPLRSGFMLGEQEGFLRTDEVTDYRVDDTPRKTERPWILLPDSFGSISGMGFISTEARYRMVRMSKTGSYGYFRREPKVDLVPTLFDFKVSGRLDSLDPTLGESTGMEIYIDDGNKKAVVALLDSLGTQYVGLLSTAPASFLGSYIATLTSWINEFQYRLLFDPAGNVQLLRIVLTDDGLDEEVLATLAYSALPVSDLPGPGLGFIHNALTIEALAEMKVGQMRYSVDMRLWDGSALPTSPWVKTGTQTPTTDGALLTVDDLLNTEALYYSRPEAALDAAHGFAAEFRTRIDSYEKDGVVNPIRELTGVGVEIDDGGEIYRLMFADAGPDSNKIIFLGTDDDVEQNLLDIRAELVTKQGTYASVDWTTSHIYRIEKTIGGQLRLYIDEDNEPSIELDVPVDSLPATVSGPEIRFGNLLDDRKSTSVWKWLRHTVSAGFDMSSFTLTSENEVLSRFDHAINVIAEAQT